MPPVSEPLYLNCELLFSLADKLNISTVDKQEMDGILHEDGKALFLTDALENRFRFEKKLHIDEDSLEVAFDGERLTLPVSCVSELSDIVVTVSGENGKTEFTDWVVKEVVRPGKKDDEYTDCSGFTVTYTSETAKDYKFAPGESLTIKVTPVSTYPEQFSEFKFDVVSAKKVVVFKGVAFKRVIKQ